MFDVGETVHGRHTAQHRLQQLRTKAIDIKSIETMSK